MIRFQLFDLLVTTIRFEFRFRFLIRIQFISKIGQIQSKVVENDQIFDIVTFDINRRFQLYNQHLDSLFDLLIKNRSKID